MKEFEPHEIAVKAGPPLWQDICGAHEWIQVVTHFHTEKIRSKGVPVWVHKVLKEELPYFKDTYKYKGRMFLYKDRELWIRRKDHEDVAAFPDGSIFLRELIGYPSMFKQTWSFR